MQKKKEIFLMIFLGIILLALNYNFLDYKLENFLSDSDASATVERIIDGDTVVAGNETIRLLGINTPEKKEFYCGEAKEFLSEKILNKTIIIKFGKDKKDRYGRTLAYIFLGPENVNLETVKNGFANYYFPSGKDKYYNSFKNAWSECIKDEINLCKKSEDKCAECIELKSLDIAEQKIILENKCNFQCELTNWEIKDEGRKKFVFPKFVLDSNTEVGIIIGNKTDTSEELFWKNEEYVWTRSGDTLFLRDKEGRLMLWEGY